MFTVYDPIWPPDWSSQGQRVENTGVLFRMNCLTEILSRRSFVEHLRNNTAVHPGWKVAKSPIGHTRKRRKS